LPVQPRTSTCLEFKAKSTALLSLISFLADLTKSAPAEKSVFDTAGNFVNRLIHGYDINTGVMLGTMVKPDGNPLALDGLWALHTLGARSVYYTAGILDEEHGLFGAIRQSR